VTHAAPDDDSDLGPCMRALPERQRLFVRLYIEQPTRDGAHIAAAAGYSSNGKSGIRVEAHRLLHSEKVLAAIREQLDKGFRTDAVIGRAVLLEIALDKEHPQRLKAATALLDRGGFHSMSEQRISVTHTDMSGEAMTERIKMLAAELGMDPARLLGHSAGTNAAPQMKVIEHEPEAVAVPAAPHAMRYIERRMLPEYLKAGWTPGPDSVRDRSDDDQVEIVWTAPGEPIMPDTRPMSAPADHGNAAPMKIPATQPQPDFWYREGYPPRG
jgi:phage terminase small subunit